MIDHKKFTQSILISLSWIRAIALIMQVVYMLWFVNPIHMMVWVLIVVQVCLLLSGWINQKLRLSQKALLINLLLDVALLGGYVYLTGGASNPLISLLLLPIVTASVALKRYLAVVVLIVAGLVYSLLYVIDQPQHHHASSFSSHLLGMWLVFIASAGLIFYVASYLSNAIRMQQKRIQQHEQRQLRDDYLTALGLSAADAAHQLNTPLSSLTVLLDDMMDSNTHNNQDMRLMQQQVQRCHTITQSIQQHFDELKSGEFRTIAIKELVGLVARNFRLLYPEIQLVIENDALQGWVHSHIGLQSALLNLLDNAAKASQSLDKHEVHLQLSDDGNYCYIDIVDQGAGLAEDVIEHYGWRPRDERTSPGGMGIGTLISNASIEQVGGHLRVMPHKPGAKIRVALPLQTQNHGKGEGE